ncbi:acetyl-CoA C-acetyltransferase [Brevibacterium sp. UCMA 11752]|uniref:acetyl-CoA C-acetyltransferase n=1 Tax=Brevibacterium sp. UCMA 11752 TaxID=2745946 RepID=UPI001F286534|nr:acetyl-CoA C-acetyltransferase [Brevibacterium sp. UCMA 11752]MCF2589265.1 acetyl-CoA C-acetyltransferase [Brevibacterium sp. UCMA 11752]
MAKNIVICEPVRTAVGGFGGQFKNLPPEELGRQVLEALITRSGLNVDVVDDVILGNCYPTMEAPAIGRVVALNAGLPITTPGRQIDRRCGSGLQAIADGQAMINAGFADVVIAGGVETMSRGAVFNEEIRWGVKGSGIDLKDSLARGRVTAGGTNYPVPGGMIETAENLRAEYSISRQEQDEFAVASHQKAATARDTGAFDDEIAAITIPATRKTPEQVITTDEHIRPNANVESLGKLRPILGSSDAEATVTAGNASGQNDGAALCIIATEEKARELGLRIFARMVGWAVAGVAPKTMGIGPVPAVAKALERAELTLADMDLIELNEAFAAQALACTREWKLGESDFAERLNVNGSGISLGHPVGATGGRILATMLHEMKRRDSRYGIETMCIGGGQGMAAVFENLAS